MAHRRTRPPDTLPGDPSTATQQLEALCEAHRQVRASLERLREALVRLAHVPPDDVSCQLQPDGDTVTVSLPATPGIDGPLQYALSQAMAVDERAEEPRGEEALCEAHRQVQRHRQAEAAFLALFNNDQRATWAAEHWAEVIVPASGHAYRIAYGVVGNVYRVCDQSRWCLALEGSYYTPPSPYVQLHCQLWLLLHDEGRFLHLANNLGIVHWLPGDPRPYDSFRVTAEQLAMANLGPTTQTVTTSGDYLGPTTTATVTLAGYAEAAARLQAAGDVYSARAAAHRRYPPRGDPS